MKVVSLLFASACLESVAGLDFQVHPVHDAFIQGGSSKNYDHSPDLQVTETYPDQDDESLIHRSYMEFDLTELSDHALDVATLRLSLGGSQKGAAIMLCPAEPYYTSTKEPISWERQPKFNCEASLGEVRYLPGMSTMRWEILPYIQQQMRLGNSVLAFVLVAAEPHYVTSFRSNEYQDRYQRPVLRLEGFVPPFTKDKFKPVLSGSRLHWPLSSPSAVSDGRFDGYATNHFQLVEDKYMQFEVQGAHHRCLVRHNSAFSVSTESKESVKATLYLPEPRYPTHEASIIQLDSERPADEELGSLVRISWRRAKSGLKDHIWATFRTSTETDDAVKVPLFARPEDFFTIEVSVAHSKVYVKLNGEAVPLLDDHISYDVTFWESVKNNVFQAGIFLNHGNGPAVAQYESLEMTPGMKKDES